MKAEELPKVPQPSSYLALQNYLTEEVVMTGIAAATPRTKSALAPEETPLSKLTRFLLVVLLDAGAIWFIQNAVSRGFGQLAITLTVIVVLLNVIFLIPKAYPF